MEDDEEYSYGIHHKDIYGWDIVNAGIRQVGLWDSGSGMYGCIPD